MTFEEKVQWLDDLSAELREAKAAITKPFARLWREDRRAVESRLAELGPFPQFLVDAQSLLGTIGELERLATRVLMAREHLAVEDVARVNCIDPACGWIWSAHDRAEKKACAAAAARAEQAARHGA